MELGSGQEAKGQPSWKISAALHTSLDIFHNILRSVRPTLHAFLFLFFTVFHLFSRWMKEAGGGVEAEEGRGSRGDNSSHSDSGGSGKEILRMLKGKERRDTVSLGGREQVEGVHSREKERESGRRRQRGEGPLTCHSEQETTEALQPPSSAELSENIWPSLQGNQVTDQSASASTRQTSASIQSECFAAETSSHPTQHDFPLPTGHPAAMARRHPAALPATGLQPAA